MGCICSKGNKPVEEPQDKQQDTEPSKSSQILYTSSRREDVAAAGLADAIAGSDGSVVRIVRKSNDIGVSPTPRRPSEAAAAAGDWSRSSSAHQRRATVDVGVHGPSPKNEDDSSMGFGDVPNGFEGEHVAAGWPPWLTSVAAEAVNGWLPMRAESFEKLDKIGQGTYSSVYKARDLETGKIVALKKVRFVNMDPESVRFMAREIHILRRLDHPNVLRLEGLVTSRMSCSLYLVFEYMEHDLAGLAARPGIKFSEPQVKCYMKQLLCGLDHCHSRGVLHRDIKGSNLLIDENGNLRIGDFGLATTFDPDQKQQRTSRVVTLWYRPPELLLGATEYGEGVDLWSTGCILAELLAGKPIMPGRTEVEQMHKIFKLCGSPSEEFWRKSKLPHATIFKPSHPYRRCVAETFKDFPPSALVLLETLLAIEPADRGTAASALQSDFFTTKPLACDPSSLPKYPPSKELDAKLREEEARRQRAAMRGNAESARGTIPGQQPITESQKLQSQTNGRNTDMYDKEDDAYSHSTRPGVGGNQKTAPMRSSTTLGRSGGPQLRSQRSHKPQEGGPDFANFAGFGMARNSAKSDNFRDVAKHPHWPEHRSSNRYNQLDVPDASHHVLDRPASSDKKDIGAKEAKMGCGARKNRIHYSGPLMPPGGNIDELLKEHERQIQQAVRKARLDKDKNNNNNNNNKHFG